MKAAVSNWEGRISPVFDVSRNVLLLTIEHGVAISRRNESIEAPTATARIERLLALGVDTLVCGAISQPVHHELTARGVRVIAFIAGEVDAVVASLLAGKVPSELLAMPGCQRQHRFRRGRDQEDKPNQSCGCRRRQGNERKE